MLYLKALMHKISYNKQIIFLMVFIGYVILDQIFTNVGFFDIVQAVLPVLCIGLAVMFLQINQKILGAHILILFTLFSGYLYNIVTSLLSLQFATLTFIKAIDGFDAIGAVVSVYLILFVFSCIMNEKKLNLDIVFYPAILFLGVYLYFRYGFYYGVVATILMMFVSLFNLKTALYLLMLSFVINAPFYFMDLIIDRVGFGILSYWIYQVFGLGLLIWIVIKLIGSLDQEKA